MSEATAVQMLGARAQGCPYIEAWFVRHGVTDADTLEGLARRYAGLSGPTSADELIDAIQMRLRMGIAYWNNGVNLADELALSGLDVSTGEDGVAGALEGDEAQARRVVAELGDGQPVGATANSLSSGAGSNARVHTDSTAAQLASQADARAFTIGRDIVLAADAPRPGTLEGDVLLAHELAHVEQQTAAASSAHASTSAAERDADRAAAGVVAQRMGVSAPPARAGVASRLSLQRCKNSPKEDTEQPVKTATGDASAQAKDAGVADAAPIDAALPPGQRSWVGTEIKKGPKEGETTGKDFPTMNAAATKFFGQEYLTKLIEQVNDTPYVSKKVDPSAIGTKTKFKVPTSVEVPTPAELLPDDAIAEGGVAYETWKVEEDPHGATKSWQPSHPTANSGVTIGRGYDMKERSGNEIERELLAAGVDAALAKKYRGAAGLSEKKADDWIKKEAPFTSLTPDQEKKLFLQEYQQVTDKTIRWFAEPKIGLPNDRGYVQSGTDLKQGIDFKSMNPQILAFLVDLRFRGDLDTKAWGYIHGPVKTNDLAALQKLVVDTKNHKTYFYANYIRYAARCRLIGVEPHSEADFNAGK